MALAFMIAAFAGAPAIAQEQVGSLVGTVKSDDTPMPGVAVEIKGSSGTLTSVTDGKGEFRFPRVSPGPYTVTAKLSGFKTYENRGVIVQLGERITVNIPLKLSTVMETIVVTGDAVQISMGENSTSATIGGEALAMLPKGRDFTSVVALAAGASNEANLGGISIDGASGSENRFVIDGIDTTHPQDGVSGQGFITDFVEEIQVKSAGYAAEFGGSLGGVINAVTKSGTNDFHGFVGGYYSNSSLNGNQNGSDRPVYQQSWPGLFRTYEKDSQSRFEPGFGIGGPIVQDTLWFYAGYSPTLVNTERTPFGSSTTYKQDQTLNYIAANIKGNIGSKLVFKLSANLTPSTTNNSLPAFDGSTPTNADLEVTTKFPTASYSLYADFVPSSNFFVSARGGYYTTDTNSSGFDAKENIRFRNGVIPVPTTDPRYRPTGFASTPAASFNATDFDEWKRKAGSLDMNFFLNAFGSHAIKAGVQLESIDNAVSSGEVGNDYEIRWGLTDRYGLGVRGTYGSVAVRRFRTEGAASASNVGLYLQDTWTIAKDFTLNLGVRTEQERVPNFGAATDPTLPENAIEFDFKDKLAPRLGFSWDVMGKQKVKVYGSYGTYYDITKLEMPRGSFGADKWITHVYPLDTIDWQTAFTACVRAENSLTQNPCPHLCAQKTRDLRLPTDPRTAIDPDLQPMENREFQLGAEYQLNKTSVVSVRYVNKKLINTIEDIGYLVFFPDGTSGEVYTTGNPGKGLVAGDPPGPVPAQAEAIRDYQAVELSFNRRFADNFSLHASYTYSKLTGNYSGLASSDEFGRTDPNVARYFDGLAYGFDSQGGIVDGVLNTDRPHAVELQGSYRAPFGTLVSLNGSWISGSPVSTDASYNGVNFFPNGRNDLGRLSSLTNFDLMLAHQLQFGKVGIELSVNVLNLLDARKVTRIGNVKYQEDVCDVRADCDGTNDWYFGTLGKYNYDAIMTAGHATPNPSFGQALAYQAPRTFRFNLKATF